MCRADIDELHSATTAPDDGKDRNRDREDHDSSKFSAEEFRSYSTPFEQRRADFDAMTEAEMRGAA